MRRGEEILCTVLHFHPREVPHLRQAKMGNGGPFGGPRKWGNVVVTRTALNVGRQIFGQGC